MIYSDEGIGVSFELPDKPSALDILRYDSRRIEHQGEDALIILWECVKPLVKSWECEALPDPNMPLDQAEGLAAAQAVEFAAFRGLEWRTALDNVSKNS